MIGTLILREAALLTPEIVFMNVTMNTIMSATAVESRAMMTAGTLISHPIASVMTMAYI